MDSFARIGPFHDVVEAEIAAALLIDQGIHASVTGAALSTMLGPIYGAAYAGGPFLLVPRDDEAAARLIIGEVEKLRQERNAASSPLCPTCGERRAERMLHMMSWIAIAGLIAALLLNGTARALAMLGCAILLLWPTQPQWKCQACGKRFAADKPVEVAAVEELDDTTDDGPE